MSNSDKEMRFFSILILVALAVVVLACTAIFIKGQKEEKAKRLEAEQRMAEYPTLEDLLAHKDEITKLATQEGDIVYEMTDKTVIAGIMNTLKGFELTAVPVNPEDDKGCPPGGVTDALVLYVYTENEGEYWELAIDDYNRPADFIIEHSTIVSAATSYCTSEMGYYTKEDKVYRKIKSIMHNGTRTDLNEQAAMYRNPEIDFLYNPEALFEGEELDFVRESGYETLDIDISEDKVFFCCNKAKESDSIYVDYEGVLFDYVWGYADKNGGGRTVFEVKSDDEEYPYAGIQGFVGATESKIYAYLFLAGMTDSEDPYNMAEIKHYLASFDYDGKLIDKVPLDYSFYKGLSVDGIVTEGGKVAIFSDGSTISLYDENLKLISTVADKEISYIAKGRGGNVVALLWNRDYIKHVVYDGTNLEIVNEYPMQYYKFDEHPLGVTDDYKVIALRYDKETCRSKIIAVDVDNYGAMEIMDVTGSCGGDGDYKESAWLEDDNTILVEERTDYDRHYVSLIKYTKQDDGQ